MTQVTIPTIEWAKDPMNPQNLHTSLAIPTSWTWTLPWLGKLHKSGDVLQKAPAVLAYYTHLADVQGGINHFLARSGQTWADLKTFPGRLEDIQEAFVVVIGRGEYEMLLLRFKRPGSSNAALAAILKGTTNGSSGSAKCWSVLNQEKITNHFNRLVLQCAIETAEEVEIKALDQEDWVVTLTIDGQSKVVRLPKNPYKILNSTTALSTAEVCMEILKLYE